MGNMMTAQKLEKAARSMICAHARQSNMKRYKPGESKYDDGGLFEKLQYLWAVGYNVPDIAKHLGLYRSQVYRIFKRMEAKGYAGRQGVRRRHRRLDLPPLPPASQ